MLIGRTHMSDTHRIAQARGAVAEHVSVRRPRVRGQRVGLISIVGVPLAGVTVMPGLSDVESALAGVGLLLRIAIPGNE